MFFSGEVYANIPLHRYALRLTDSVIVVFTAFSLPGMEPFNSSSKVNHSTEPNCTVQWVVVNITVGIDEGRSKELQVNAPAIRNITDVPPNTELVMTYTEEAISLFGRQLFAGRKRKAGVGPGNIAQKQARTLRASTIAP